MKRKDTAHISAIRAKQKSAPVRKTTVQRGNYIPRKPDKRKKRDPSSTQNSIPYKAMYRDGICHTKDGRFSKTIRFYDINYQLAQNEDKTSIRAVYEPYMTDPRPEKTPILEDLYDYFLAYDHPKAKRIAMTMEIYVHGSLNVFNHRTNIDLTNRLICFDIKDLGKQLKKLGMLIVQDQVWGRVTENRTAHRHTWFYCDEFHLLLKEEQTAAYSVEIWKRFRKWGGIPTAITQNVKDLLASREVENIFENSDFIYMLNQASGDRQILAKALSISNHQLSYVTNSSEVQAGAERCSSD